MAGMRHSWRCLVSLMPHSQSLHGCASHMEGRGAMLHMQPLVGGFMWVGVCVWASHTLLFLNW